MCQSIGSMWTIPQFKAQLTLLLLHEMKTWFPRIFSISSIALFGLSDHLILSQQGNLASHENPVVKHQWVFFNPS